MIINKYEHLIEFEAIVMYCAADPNVWISLHWLETNVDKDLCC
jgi:hypothetical protein